MFCNLDRPLNEVSCWWIRIPATIILSVAIIPFVILFHVIIALFEAIQTYWDEFLYPCLRGPK